MGAADPAGAGVEEGGSGGGDVRDVGAGGVGKRVVGRGTPGPGWTLGAFRRGWSS